MEQEAGATYLCCMKADVGRPRRRDAPKPIEGELSVQQKEKQMTKLAIAGAAMLFALAAPLPVFAQAAVSEPGMVSFYHPNADILHAGPGAYGYGAPPAYAPPYEANAYVGGPVVDQAYPVRRSGRPVHHRSHVSPY
jgi:hypothetical protein